MEEADKWWLMIMIGENISSDTGSPWYSGQGPIKQLLLLLV